MAEEEQGVPVEETGQSKNKLMIMVAGGVVLLAVIVGAGLYFTGFFEDEKPVTVDSQNSANEELKEVGADSEVDLGGNVYQALTPPFIVNFPEGDIKVMKLAISIMAKDEQLIAAVKKHDPVIRNNILMLLSTQDPESLKTTEGKTQLQGAIKEAVNTVLIERNVSSKVKEVFFTDLVMQ
jgi:flagellar protein FliL